MIEDIELPHLPECLLNLPLETLHDIQSHTYHAIKADRQQRGEPDYFTYMINGHHRGISETIPPDDSYDVGTLMALYAAPHSAEPSRAPALCNADSGAQNGIQATQPVEPLASDRQMLLKLMEAFNTETWQCPNCGNAEDTATMDSAYMLRDYLKDMTAADPVNRNEEYKPEYKHFEDGKVVWTNAADAPVVKSSEPVKVPSDEIVEAVEAYGKAYSMPNTTASELSIRLHEIRALLARYGDSHIEHPIAPEGWQVVPKDPDVALLASMATCLYHGFALLDKDLQDAMLCDMRKLHDEIMGRGYYTTKNRDLYLLMLKAAPANDPSRKFQLGNHVRKTKGSNWRGRVVGTYSTSLTPEGYAVESDTETGSVQIYPAQALELVS